MQEDAKFLVAVGLAVVGLAALAIWTTPRTAKARRLKYAAWVGGGLLLWWAVPVVAAVIGVPLSLVSDVVGDMGAVLGVIASW